MTDALYNPQWGRMVAVPESLHGLMAENGFAAVHTGGGCMAWQRELNDHEYFWITAEDDISGDPKAPIWIIGRYNTVNDDLCWYTVSHATLAQALTAMDAIPQPTSDNGDTCISWQEYSGDSQ